MFFLWKSKSLFRDALVALILRLPDRSLHSVCDQVRCAMHVCLALCLILFLTKMQCLLDQRQNLKFLVEGQSPAQCWSCLEAVYGAEAMSKPTVRR